MIYILITRLYFFVWTPQTQNFNCMNDDKIPLYQVDLGIMNEAMEKKTPEAFNKAQELSRGVIEFIKSLPGEDKVGAAIIEGPYNLGMAGAKFAQWKLKTSKNEYAPLNKMLTELGINSTQNS